jgi:transcription antitermination factor NusA-like protein
VYEAGIINVAEARKRTREGKLHLDVPEDEMGMIIGRQGSNINAVTNILREKGIDLSKIILHPKSREEIKITLESIEKAVREQRNQSHDEQ